jgi:hypothetical protein
MSLNSLNVYIYAYNVTRITYSSLFYFLNIIRIKNSNFWDIKPCILFKANRHFGGTCWLTFNGLQGVMSQKIVLVTTTALRNPNPADMFITCQK